MEKSAKSRKQSLIKSYVRMLAFLRQPSDRKATLGFIGRSLLLMYLMMMAIVLGESAGLSCGRYEMLIAGTCTKCPTCPPGQGLDRVCGYGDGDGAVCRSCPSGTYNAYPGGSTCEHCVVCSQFNRQELYKCRPVIDAECGPCLPGYYDLHSDLAMDGMAFPCERCNSELSHPSCQQMSAQIVPPVTIKLQADNNPLNDDDLETNSKGYKTSAIAIGLGALCLITFFAIFFLLVRQKRLNQRLQSWYGRHNGAQGTSHVFQESSRNQETQVHQHDRDCMSNAQLAAPWCPVIALRPEVDNNVKHPTSSLDSQTLKRQLPPDNSSAGESMSDIEDKFSDTRNLLQAHRIRKRAKTESKCDVKADNAEVGLTLRLRQKINQDRKSVINDLSRAHNIENARMSECIINSGLPRDDAEDQESFEEDQTMDEEENVQTVPASNTNIPFPGRAQPVTNLLSSTDSSNDEDDEEDDLQQYGACAMPRQSTQNHKKLPVITSEDSCSSNLAFGGLELEDSDNSQGSLGNISQASTVLIRGQANEESQVLTNDLFQTLAGKNDQDLDDMDFSFPCDIHPTPRDSDFAQEQETMQPSNQNLPAVELNRCDTAVNTDNTRFPASPSQHILPSNDSIIYGSPSHPPSLLAPAPRRLAGFASGFTASRGDLADSAETALEELPRSLWMQDEEHYVQALHLAEDHLVSDLDYEIIDHLGVVLLPRGLPGDRNFHHLGLALGVPVPVMEGLKTFDEVLVHLRRRRVLLVTFLKAMRTLNRMDALHLLSQWVIENYSHQSVADCENYSLVHDPGCPVQRALCIGLDESTPIQETSP